MTPRRFYVIGDPIGHSLSPIMQGAALRALGLRHSFEAMRVARGELPAVLDRVRRGVIHGLNVTVPHKVEALRLCDLFTDEVAAVGAVNTIFLDATGRLVGSNTDVDGLRADLLAEEIVPRSALILGTGGAARAAVAALGTLGRHVTVAGRDDQAAQRLVHEVGVGQAIPWSELAPPPGVEPFDLVLNATSAGMAGGPEGTPIAEAWARARKDAKAVAYDLVYRPPEGRTTTPFLARAALEGYRTATGLGMLVEQGARALSIFLGIPIAPPVKREMRAAIEAAVGPKA